MSFSTTYMVLTLPSVGVDTGPAYANLVNTALVAIDAHNHSQSVTGNGRPIDQTGIVLTGDLPIGGFNLTNAKSLRMPDNGGAFASSVIGAVYRNGPDLYYNDGSGTAIRITASGAVNTGGSGSISGMDATSAVTYSTVNKTYTFTQSAGFPAKLISGDIQIFETTSGAAQALTLKVPAGFASAYTLTLPAALPGSNALMQGTSAGVLSFVTTLPSGLTIPAPAFGATDGGLAVPGLILPYGGQTAPSGWLLCDGSAVSRATYAALFAVVGTSYGIGDGSTTFNVPDVRGRFLRAYDAGAGNDPDASTRTQLVAGTWTLAACTKTNGSPTVGVTELANIAVGMTMTGTGIPASTYVRAKSAASGAGNITMGNAANTANVNATDGATITITFGKSPSGAYLGSLQADGIKNHLHAVDGVLVGGTQVPIPGGGSYDVTTASSQATGGNESRPKNLYSTYIIRT